MYYEEKKKNKEKLILYSFMVIVIALLSIVIVRTEAGQDVTTVAEYNAEKVNFDESDFRLEEVSSKDDSNVMEKSVNSVVGISKLKQNGTSIFVNNAEEKLGLGSGVIVTDTGFILTNQHVAGNKYSTCFVTLDDGKTYDGSVVWADENVDLAIVKISKGGLDYLRLGDSDSLELAQDVYAIGNPLGMEFQKTVTKGIISSLNRTIKIEDEDENVYMEDLIQTDATINEGNSGGALINGAGELIGINTVKISNAEGIGFAVPINIVKPIIDKLTNNGKFEEAWLGIHGYDKEAIKYLDSNLKLENGIYVAQVAENGPLVDFDVREGDVITKIDNTNISKMNDLKKYIYGKSPNDMVKLHIQRNGKEHKIEVILKGKN